MAGPRNIHIATAGYVRRWADSAGQVMRVPIFAPSGAERKKPEKVGFRPRFWGPDPELARATEERLNRYESLGIEGLRQLDRGLWPSDIATRQNISFIVAVHMVRNPAFWRSALERQETALTQRLPEWRGTLTEKQLAEGLAYLRSRRFQIGHMLDLIPKYAALIASMHWTLIEFTEPLIATSDQPVAIFPILDNQEIAQVDAIPTTGYLDTEEIRFPVDPYRSLIFTWYDAHDTGRIIQGDRDLAAELNRPIIGQADRDYFHHTGGLPPRLKSNGDFNVLKCSGVGCSLLPDYGTEYARQSHRRKATTANVNQMIEERIADRMIVTRPGLVEDGA